MRSTPRFPAHPQTRDGARTGVGLDFKRCGNQFGADVFETICSFANRQCGSLLLGVLDDGAVEGIPEASVLPMERSLVNVTCNPKLFSAAPAIVCERIPCGDGHAGPGRRPGATGKGGGLHGERLFTAAESPEAETDEDRFWEHAMSQVRSLVEHPFRYLGDVMRTRGARCRGRRKNDQMPCTCLAMSNLLMLTRRRVALPGVVTA